jgi:hypothetical protein
VLSTRLILVLSGLNVALVLITLTTAAHPAAGSPASPQVLRGSGLEIVDAQGRVRASIELVPADSSIRMPDGSMGSPETVLLRLRSASGHPNVKLAATEDGAGLTLGSAVPDTYIQLRARGAPPILRLNDGTKAPVLISP